MSDSFLNEMSDQIRHLTNGTGNAKVVFVIGRALKGQINNENRTIFGSGDNFDTYIALTNKLFIFSSFKCSHIEEQSSAGQLLGGEPEL
jgi:hypothetical protein